MDEALYLFSLGFSGSDAVRALVLLLLGSLFVTNRFPPWKMTILLLTIDQLWPYGVMLHDGLGPRAIELALRGGALHWQDALIGFLIRAGGFYLFVRGTFSLRRKLHNALPEEGNRGANPL
ncbi:MAG: hypothetical protein V2I43_23230 [Parvularcula sp.]|jgi:hypothetical protein|nr:hypothetical protein [Parvularcula sp.]